MHWAIVASLLPLLFGAIALSLNHQLPVGPTLGLMFGLSALIGLYIAGHVWWSRRRWNDGIHRECGGAWHQTLLDSQGNYQVTCQNCGRSFTTLVQFPNPIPVS
jgi:hypothetical protein